MAYTKIGWENLPSTKTPINDVNLNHMDDGIFNNDAAITELQKQVNLVNLPIGSLYWNETDITETINQYFVGTWVRVKDVFILAAGDTYAANSSGGAATHTHSQGDTGASTGNTGASSGNTGASSGSTGGPSTTNTGSTTLTENQLPKISGQPSANVLCHQAYSIDGGALDYIYGGSAVGGGNSSFSYGQFKVEFGGGQGHTHSLNSHTHSLNSHTHSLNSHTHSLNSHTHTNPDTGSSSNMPPYYTAYCWKRTA